MKMTKKEIESQNQALINELAQTTQGLKKSYEDKLRKLHTKADSPLVYIVRLLVFLILVIVMMYMWYLIISKFTSFSSTPKKTSI